MDTYMTVSACGEGAEETLEQEVYRLDQLLAAVNGKGEIARLNKRGKATLSEETGALVERNLELYRETGGSFDIAVYLLMKAWVFTDEHYRIPGKEELAKLRQLTDASQIDYDASKRRAAFWKAHSQEFDAIFMTDEDKLYVTAGIAQRFSSDKYKTAIITK